MNSPAELLANLIKVYGITDATEMLAAAALKAAADKATDKEDAAFLAQAATLLMHTASNIAAN